MAFQSSLVIRETLAARDRENSQWQGTCPLVTIGSVMCW